MHNTCRPLAALHRYSSSTYLSSRGYAISSVSFRNVKRIWMPIARGEREKKWELKGFVGKSSYIRNPYGWGD